jgi:hypothetical protein
MVFYITLLARIYVRDGILYNAVSPVICEGWYFI